MTRRGRRRQDDERGPAGFLVVDKPTGWTSHDVVDAARRWLSARRVGHLGTLDPLATGVLPLAVRSATRLVHFVQDHDKAYTGSLRLGVETDTLDASGKIVRCSDRALPDEAAVRDALRHFLGEVEQIPPMFSAVKQGGIPLHRLAREGQQVERAPKTVRIHRLELLKYAPPVVELSVECSGGTYVRVLAADLGARLGCGAHLIGLRRTRSGPFDLSQALTLEQLEAEAESGQLERRLIPPLGVLGLPALRVSQPEIEALRRGSEITAAGPPRPPGSQLAAHDERGNVVAILEAKPGRRLQPVRVLAAFAADR
jgi:tRNA pseudouridine55 synthase